MSKKNSSNLHPLGRSDFFQEMLPAQAETVVGGNTIVDLSTIHDGVNNLSNRFPSFVTVDNNKLFTFDFSRLTINWVIMFPDDKSLVFSWLI
jgi:hypothetical protein